jgi:hypothetical protein
MAQGVGDAESVKSATRSAKGLGAGLTEFDARRDANRARDPDVRTDSRTDEAACIPAAG